MIRIDMGFKEFMERELGLNEVKKYNIKNNYINKRKQGVQKMRYRLNEGFREFMERELGLNEVKKYNIKKINVEDFSDNILNISSSDFGDESKGLGYQYLADLVNKKLNIKITKWIYLDDPFFYNKFRFEDPTFRGLLNFLDKSPELAKKVITLLDTKFDKSRLRNLLPRKLKNIDYGVEYKGFKKTEYRKGVRVRDEYSYKGDRLNLSDLKDYDTNRTLIDIEKSSKYIKYLLTIVEKL